MKRPTPFSLHTSAFSLLLLAASALAQTTAPAPASAPALPPPNWVINASLPTLFIAGDSTAQPVGAGPITPTTLVGWGNPFHTYLDPAKINFVNAARGGRSSRTFITEGLWDQMLDKVKPGDIVLIQFGQNDGAGIDKPPFRASLKGLGDDTQTVDNTSTKRTDTVHTFGWYMRKMTDDVKAKHATPILLSLTTRDMWKDDKVERENGNYNAWTKETAATEKVTFLDAADLIADTYEKQGQEKTKTLFPRDPVHVGSEGAALNAKLILSALKSLHNPTIDNALTPAAAEVPAADPKYLVLPPTP